MSVCSTFKFIKTNAALGALVFAVSLTCIAGGSLAQTVSAPSGSSGGGGSSTQGTTQGATVGSTHGANPTGATIVNGGRLNFTFTDINGNLVSSTDDRFKGKVVVVAIWGTWCAPARSEIPVLKKIHADYKRRGVEVVSIAFEPPNANALKGLKEFVKQSDIDYTVLNGGSMFRMRQELPDVANFRGAPTLFFVGRDGIVKNILVGYYPATTPSTVERQVIALLPDLNSSPTSPAPTRTTSRSSKLVRRVISSISLLFGI